MHNKDMLKELNFFYMLAFLASGVFYALAMAICTALTLGQTETMLLTTMLAQFAQAFAAFLTMKRYKQINLIKKGIFPPRAALLCLLVPLLGVGSQVVLHDFKGNPMVSSAFFATASLGALTVVTTLVGSVTEEIGWRGYLQSRLSAQLAPWKSGALTALMWGVWHFTKIFHQGLLSYLLFVLSVLPLGMLMSYLTDKARGGLLPAIVLHTLYNLAFMAFLYERESQAGYIAAFLVLTLFLLALRLVDPIYFQQDKGNDAGGLNAER